MEKNPCRKKLRGKQKRREKKKREKFTLIISVGIAGQCEKFFHSELKKIFFFSAFPAMASRTDLLLLRYTSTFYVFKTKGIFLNRPPTDKAPDNSCCSI